jgi:hypothetical protein
MAITSSVVANTTTTRIFLASGDQAITTIMFCNFDSAISAFLDVYAVASGGVVSTGTQILKYISLPPTETFVMDTEKLILANGDAIWAQTSSTSECVSASVSSVGI